MKKMNAEKIVAWGHGDVKPLFWTPIGGWWCLYGLSAAHALCELVWTYPACTLVLYPALYPIGTGWPMLLAYKVERILRHNLGW